VYQILLFSWLSSLREAAIAFELLRKTTTEDFTTLRHAWSLREMPSQPFAHLSTVLHFKNHFASSTTKNRMESMSGKF
jgi:hypothetical protein